MTTQNPKTWFITGTSAGFGRAFAEYALSQGYNVVATARNTDKLEDIVAQDPQRVLAVTLDVTNPDHLQPAIQAALEKFGSIDVLLNNAGYGIVGAVEETPEAELRAQLETNFFGAVNVMKAVLPILRKQGNGAVVNISSMGGAMSFPGFGAYSASKFALEGLSEALVQEMQPFGVKVMIVEPGAFRTSFAGSALRHMPKIDAYEKIVGGIRTFAQEMDQAQEGDPLKAAAVIDKALQAENTPMRLQLGEDSIGAVRAHTETMLAEIKEWEPLGLDTKLDNLETAS